MCTILSSSVCNGILNMMGTHARLHIRTYMHTYIYSLSCTFQIAQDTNLIRAHTHTLVSSTLFMHTCINAHVDTYMCLHVEAQWLVNLPPLSPLPTAIHSWSVSRGAQMEASRAQHGRFSAQSQEDRKIRVSYQQTPCQALYMYYVYALYKCMCACRKSIRNRIVNNFG